MQRSKNDLWVGLFVLIGAAAVLFLALNSEDPPNSEPFAFGAEQQAWLEGYEASFEEGEAK